MAIEYVNCSQHFELLQLCKAEITFDLTSTVDTVTVTWTKEDGHGYTSVTFEVNNEPKGATHPAADFDANSGTTSETFTGLESGTEYNVVVKNAFAEVWSDSIYTGE